MKQEGVEALYSGVGRSILSWQVLQNKGCFRFFSGRGINTYLQSLGTGFDVDSRVGITIEPTAVNENNTYYVCATFKEKIDTAVNTRKRKSDQHDPQARKRFCMDSITRVTAVLGDIKNDLQEVYCIYQNVPVTNMDDDAEEVRVEKNKTRIGHCQTFPQAILNF